jgi:hypothetical protein
MLGEVKYPDLTRILPSGAFMIKSSFLRQLNRPDLDLHPQSKSTVECHSGTSSISAALNGSSDETNTMSNARLNISAH